MTNRPAKITLGAIALGALIAMTGTPASAAPELTDAKARVYCDKATIGVRGTLEKPEIEGTVDLFVLFTPPHGGEVRTLEASIDVVGGLPDGEFEFFFTKPPLDELCGWYDISGQATLRNWNTIPIDVVVPDSGRIDCCTGTLGDFVWEDLNINGVQDPGEPGIGGVTIVLTDRDGQARETVTEADGSYLFADLCPGNYTVDVIESTLPPDKVPTEPNVGDDGSDSDGPLDGSAIEVRLTQDECDDPTIDFGYFCPIDECAGVIGDFVWSDENDDGIQDPGEPGKEGVEVCLTDSSGNLVECVLTDPDGFYLFDELCADDYTVEVDESTLPGDTAPTIVGAGDDPEADSNPNPSMVTLPADDSADLSIDFGCGLCDECDGKVTMLSLRYDGDVSGFVEVEQKKDGDVIFAGDVDPGEVFSFSGTDDNGTMGTEIIVFVDGDENVRIHTSCSQPIGPGLVFGDFTVIAGKSRNGGLMCPLNACDVESLGLDIDDDKIEWEIENVGQATITIESIEITWPMVNGDITEIKLDGTISDGDFAPPSVVVDSFVGDLEDRQIKDGGKEKLEIKFENKPIDQSNDEYAITVNFVEGCSITFVPGQEPFTCDKPIDELVMIWDGGESVDVMAWKGSPGSELLADVSGIAVGAELAVDGYAGSPNDVFWEVFSSATGSLIGESKFHLSCSDDDMDGEEDCGKRQGNGKGDEGLNDWLLEGMSDSRGQFDCTP